MEHVPKCFSQHSSLSVCVWAWSELTTEQRSVLSPIPDDSKLFSYVADCRTFVLSIVGNLQAICLKTRHHKITITSEHQQHQARFLLKVNHKLLWEYCFLLDVVLKAPLLKSTDLIPAEPWLWSETSFCSSEFIKKVIYSKSARNPRSNNKTFYP